MPDTGGEGLAAITAWQLDGLRWIEIPVFLRRIEGQVRLHEAAGEEEMLAQGICDIFITRPALPSQSAFTA